MLVEIRLPNAQSHNPDGLQGNVQLCCLEENAQVDVQGRLGGRYRRFPKPRVCSQAAVALHAGPVSGCRDLAATGTATRHHTYGLTSANEAGAGSCAGRPRTATPVGRGPSSGSWHSLSGWGSVDTSHSTPAGRSAAVAGSPSQRC